MRSPITDPIKPEIVYLDDYLLVLNKPPAMHSVDLAKNSSAPSVASWLAEEFPETKEAAPKRGDSGLVHRLDFETSGLLLAARSRAVWEKLHKMLLAGEIEKSYLAVLEGCTPPKFECRASIGARSRGSKKVIAFDAKPPKGLRWKLPAHTRFQTVRQIKRLEASLVRVFASPARRHQVRAHAAFCGHPLLGDVLYGSTRQGPGDNSSFVLHAESIKLMHPVMRKELRLSVAPWAAAATCRPGGLR